MTQHNMQMFKGQPLCQAATEQLDNNWWGGGGGGCRPATYLLLVLALKIIVQELCESRGGRPSWAVRPNEPSGFRRGRKAILNHASITACP